MKFALCLITLLLAPKGFALTLGEVDIDDEVPNFCWQDTSDKQVCLYDQKKTVRVIIYTAGYCQSCAQDLPKVIARLSEIKDQPVVFYNVVSEGDTEGSEPTTDVLKAWKSRLGVPFTVAASPHDAGTAFYFHAAAPVVALVDKDNTLNYKEDKIDPDELFKSIRETLAEKPDDGH